MNMKNIFLNLFAAAYCGGMLVAATPVTVDNENERTQIGENSLPKKENEAMLTERFTKNGDEAEDENALSTLPTPEIAIISAELLKEAALKEDQSLTALALPATGLVKFGHPGVFKQASHISGNKVYFEDGSRWKVHKNDLYFLKDWDTSSNSFVPDDIVIALNTDLGSYLSYRYCLVNQQTGVAVRAEPNLAPLNYLKRYIFSYAWLNDSYGNLYVQLCLNDGSVWNMISSDFPFTALWDRNHTVIIGSNNGAASAIAPNILINLNSNNYGAGRCIVLP